MVVTFGQLDLDVVALLRISRPLEMCLNPALCQIALRNHQQTSGLDRTSGENAQNNPYTQFDTVLTLFIKNSEKFTIFKIQNRTAHKNILIEEIN